VTWGSVSQRGIPEIIQNWSNQRIKALQNNLLKNNSTASKRLYQDISGDVSTTPGGYNLSINDARLLLLGREWQKAYARRW
jgi:hypothetical protein